jgi:hypothetical protein
MIKLDIHKCNNLIARGFSLITATADKVPVGSWKQAQQTATDIESFRVNYLKPKAKAVGIVTGFNDLECLDVDLKVFSTAKEKSEWWAEYLSFLEDNIFNFKDKFVIAKTINDGFHILYKSKRVEGNLKVAKLKGHKQQILETRGNGGYIVAYSDILNGKEYTDIDYISEEDREVLFSISKTYDHKEEAIELIDKPKKDKVISTGLSAWEDYNNKTSILDLIGADFDVVRNLKDKYIIRRKGADSAHSGYIYKDNGLMYLFTSGTSFEAEKGYNPFMVYAHYIHNDDGSAAATDLYKQGFGERIAIDSPLDVTLEDKEVCVNTEFPLEIFPLELQHYILERHRTLKQSIDYMGCSLLFLTSIIVGNSQQIKIKNGWNETPSIWLSLVGKAGVGKTPSIKGITFPLDRANSAEIKKYIVAEAKFDEFNNMDAKEKALTEPVYKPKKTQFLVNDVTLEALVELHNENTNGIGVLKDELAGFFKDMNKYRDGGDMEHWLSSWSGGEINLNRKTAKSSFVERAFLPIMGGIQPSILDGFQTEENKSNGFIDRMLFSYPELEVEDFVDEEISQDLLEWYDTFIIKFYESTKRNLRLGEGNVVEAVTAEFTPEAKIEYKRIHKEITAMQKSEDIAEANKSMLPKMKAYVARFALLINTLESQKNTDIHKDEVEKSSVLKAEKLAHYFIDMANKIKIESAERTKIKSSFDNKKDAYTNFKSIYTKNPDVSQKDIADMLGKSIRTTQRYITKFNKEK